MNLKDHPDAARLLERWLSDCSTQASSKQRLASAAHQADPWTLEAYRRLAKAHHDVELRKEMKA